MRMTHKATAMLRKMTHVGLEQYYKMPGEIKFQVFVRVLVNRELALKNVVIEKKSEECLPSSFFRRFIFSTGYYFIKHENNRYAAELGNAGTKKSTIPFNFLFSLLNSNFQFFSSNRLSEPKIFTYNMHNLLLTRL